MENKKSNVGWIIITIVLLIIIGGLTFIILKDKEVIKVGNTTKKETKVVEKTKKESKKEEKSDNKTNDNSSEFRIYSGDIIRENKDFGKILFNNKKVNIKYEETNSDEDKLYVDDKYIEIGHRGLNNIAIMGNYLVIGLDGNGYGFEIYNSNMEKVDEGGHSLGLLTGTTADTSKWIIDENNLIYYQCDADYNSRDNDTLKTYNLKIDGSKIEKVLLSTNEGVACTPER